jgi:hypothetical protein
MSVLGLLFAPHFRRTVTPGWWSSFEGIVSSATVPAEPVVGELGPLPRIPTSVRKLGPFPAWPPPTRRSREPGNQPGDGQMKAFTGSEGSLDPTGDGLALLEKGSGRRPWTAGLLRLDPRRQVPTDDVRKSLDVIPEPLSERATQFGRQG